MNLFSKPWALVRTSWQAYLSYRVSLISYRLGDMAEVIILVLMWTAIYGHRDVIQGFTLSEMLTYVLIGNVFRMITGTFIYENLAWDIKKGRISNVLVKPVSHFWHTFFSNSAIYTLINPFGIVTQLGLAAIITRQVIWQAAPGSALVITAMIFLAFWIEWMISYLIGLSAFWFTDFDGIFAAVDAVRWILAGTLFPLSLLPAWFLNLGLSLPFAYSFFAPMQLYLGKMSAAIGLRGILIQVAWLAALALIIKIVWKKGLKKYEGVGI